MKRCMKYDQFVLILLIVVFGAGIIFTARGALSPYVTFAEAKESDRTVQIKGTAVDGSLREIDASSFSFKLKDMSGDLFTVIHNGSVPLNLFTADFAVVSGRFRGGEFIAGNILVKCPTKYRAENQ